MEGEGGREGGWREWRAREGNRTTLTASPVIDASECEGGVEGEGGREGGWRE